MYSYRGPKSVVNTYGTAILSKYPISNVSAFFMYSTHQQIGATQVQITVESQTFNVFSHHPSSHTAEGKIYQIQEMLSRVDGLNNVIFMGDFNFRPYTAQYNITVEVLEDSWVQQWGTAAEDRIDHIFLSTGITVLNTNYIERGHSDHPAYWIEIQL